MGFARLVFNNFFQTKIIVASSGRAGSTMLFRAIADSLLKDICRKYCFNFNFLDEQIAPRLLGDFVSSFYSITQSSAPILKTHSLPPNLRVRSKYRCIFVYGSPIDSAYSAYKVSQKRSHRWLDRHIFHLGGAGSASELFTHDILNYEKQLEMWFLCDDALKLHYSQLWDSTNLISDFLGFNVSLPKKISRTPTPDYALRLMDNPVFSKLLEFERNALNHRRFAGS